MKRYRDLFLFVFTLQTVYHVSSIQGTLCGPERNCDCFKTTTELMEMTCLQHLELKTICASIRNDTIYNVSTLVSKLSDERLTSDDFVGCETLQEMYLANNSLKNIQGNALVNMSKLTYLDLSFNKLDIYRKGISFLLRLPENLRVLKINGNIPMNTDTEHVNYPAFHPSDSLNELYLDGLVNKSIDVFRGNPNALQSLIMSGMSGYCNLFKITDKTFHELKQLKLLSISDCNLELIEFGAFRNLRHLEVLNMSNNRQLGVKTLQNISYGLQSTNIKIFNYSHVELMFGPAITLKKRDVCFLWNTTLEEFVLEGNRIQIIESNALILFPLSLKVLRIGYNRLTIAVYILQVGCLSNLIQLHSGYLDTFGIAENPFKIMSHVSKHEDDCDGGQFYTCPFMSDDRLKDIAFQKPDCLFYDGDNFPLSIPRQIRNIYAPQCGFVPALISILNFATFLDLPIELLDVSRNNIYRVPSLYMNLKTLKYLDLSENHCSKLEKDSGQSVPNLENLQIQKNLLGMSVPDYQFEYFQNLKVLNLSDNALEYLPEHLFFNLTKLEVLDLSDNKIQNWTADVSTLKSLTHLNLSNNVIGYLPSYLTAHFEKMENFSIDLQNNSLQCTCEHKDFLQWLVKYKRNMVGYKNYKFYSEYELAMNKFESEVFYLDKRCASYTFTIVFTSLFIATFLSTVLGGIVYKNRWQIRYFVYMTKRKYFQYKPLPEDEPTDSYEYNAFISYADDNMHFISEELVPTLEQQGISLCVHQRDFVPGRSVIDNIIGAIQSSRKTVAILSREFISSRWCMYEFHMARMESIYSRDDKGCLLIIMKEAIPIEDMPLELVNWIRYESYLEYTEEVEGKLLFWARLKETLKTL